LSRFLIFDLGASNGRTILGTFDGNKITFEDIHRFDNRPVYAAGELFWDTLRHYSEVKIGIEICSKKYGRVNSMAIDTWGCDFGFIDKSGRLICNPVHYRDSKRHERAAKLHEIISEKELFMKSGGPQDKIMSIYQLFSLKYEKAVEYENAYKFLMIPDILNYFLTGEVSNEFTNASMSIMCNLNTRQWEKEIINRLGFKEILFSHLVEPGTELGLISKPVRDELSTRALKVIIPATHDTASAVAGIPVRDPNKVWAFGILGTWCMTGIETQKPIINEKTFYSGFGNEGGVEGKNMLLKNIIGLWIIQQCREKWSRDALKEIPWKEIDVAISDTPKSDSHIDVDDARFGKVQNDMSGVISDYCRSTGQNIPKTIGEISRCFYESLALKFRQNIGILQELTDKKLEVLHLIGGGVKNALLCQWIADALSIPVIAGPTETTSAGNILFQLKAGGFISNMQEGRKISVNSFDTIVYEPKDTAYWDEKYQKYLKIINKN